MADVEQPVSLLWNHRRGELLCPDAAFRIFYAIEPKRGTLVSIVPHAALDADEATLCIPADGNECLQLLVELRGVTEEAAGAAADRFSAYHGANHKGLWCIMKVIGGKVSGIVLEPDDLPLAHALAPTESALLRQLNADRALLARAVNSRLGIMLHDAIAVGVDPRGIDIRAAEGINRITFVRFAEDTHVASQRIGELLARHGALN